MNSALLTDLYQFTMLQAYFDEGMHDEAVFEFYVRELPRERNFLLFVGLDPLLDELQSLAVSDDELAWLATLGRFRPDFLDWLGKLRYQGDVDALAEGTPFFANEPVVRVTAPIAQAQWIESRLINQLHYQILVASKAARCVLAAPGKRLVDFGFRRAHGFDAGLLAARAAFVAGFDGSATVLAGRHWGLPVFGTMAHSYILAHDNELEAFERFALSHPQRLTLLIDSYDTEAAARKVVALAGKLAAQGIAIDAVRLDSGDLAAQAKSVRKLFDSAGWPGIGIFCSGDLDEYEIARLIEAGAPVDGFGIGTRLATSNDAPYLNCAYKLQQYAGKPRRKRSSGKATWPGVKQLFRHDAEGVSRGDLVALVHETQPGEALLQPVMRAGERLSPPLRLSALREATRERIARLPAPLRTLAPSSYPVTMSAELVALAATLDRQAH